MSSASRAELAEELRKLGVEMVIAEYDGFGDSGQIENPEFGSKSVPHDMAMAVQDLFYDLLAYRFAGWEINEGSFGQFKWDLRADSIDLVHTVRVEDTQTETL